MRPCPPNPALTERNYTEPWGLGFRVLGQGVGLRTLNPKDPDFRLFDSQPDVLNSKAKTRHGQEGGR